jgi:beta-N-acetylglucosaminidase
MIANRMSSFAAGIIVATTVLGAAYYISSPKVEMQKERPSEEEMKSVLSESGYVIVTEEEWKAVQHEDTKQSESAQVKEQPQVVQTTVLNVTTGMTSIDVGKVLVQAGIIDNAMTFFKEVEKRELASKLRPGTYEINSEMTMDEVIASVFK